MTSMLDAFWRAAAYCLHPRVIGLSLLPLLLMGVLCVGLGWFFWEPAVAGVRAWLEGWSLVQAMLQWLEALGAEGFRAVLAPLLVVAMAVPVIVVLCFMLVALLMTPSVVALVAERRFPALARRRGAGVMQQVGWSVGCSAAALGMLAATLPLWLVPPLALLLPPLIWGWLTCKVLGFDVLADHAARDERRALLARHRWPLWAMGLAAGFLGTAPGLIWAAGALTLVFAPLLVLVSIWLYTLVFAFSTLWFAHYLLAALDALRGAEAARAAAVAPAAATGGAELPGALPAPSPPPPVALPACPSPPP